MVLAEARNESEKSEHWTALSIFSVHQKKNCTLIDVFFRLLVFLRCPYTAEINFFLSKWTIEMVKECIHVAHCSKMYTKQLEFSGFRSGFYKRKQMIDLTLMTYNKSVWDRKKTTFKFWITKLFALLSLFVLCTVIQQKICGYFNSFIGNILAILVGFIFFLFIKLNDSLTLNHRWIDNWVLGQWTKKSKLLRRKKYSNRIQAFNLIEFYFRI